MASMTDKVAVVTGGSSGIGRATAVAFAQAGAKVVVGNRSAAGGEETLQRIKQAGGEGRFVQTDVSQAKDVERLIKTAMDAFGRIDYAFNNAGIEGELAPCMDCAEENWDRVLAVNLTGIWQCVKHELAQMCRQGHGAIVNCSSVAGLVGVRGLPAYVASKHGVLGLTKTAALEYAPQGIRVNAVCPGAIETPMLERIFQGNPEARRQIRENEPIGRIGRPEEVAGAVLWLCSDEASFVTGHSMVVDGGWVAQ